MLCHDTGDSDPGRFDGKDLINLLSFESFLEFLSNLIKQRDIHLMVQETVHLEHISILYNSILQYTFF